MITDVEQQGDSLSIYKRTVYTCNFWVKFLFGLEIISNAIQANSSRKMNNELELPLFWDQSLAAWQIPHDATEAKVTHPLEVADQIVLASQKHLDTSNNKVVPWLSSNQTNQKLHTKWLEDAKGG